jgi:hypothetical protein
LFFKEGVERKMEDTKTLEELHERKRSTWSRRFAIGFCAVASILGWAAIAGLFIGVWSDSGPQIANEKGVEALSDIAPAAGPTEGTTKQIKP